MKIMVRTIPSAGLDLDKTISLEELGLADTEFSGLGPLNVRARVERIGDTVIAHTQVNTNLTAECARCLDTVEVKAEKQYDFDYKVDKTTHAIDLGEDIRQEVILDLPMKVLCRQDCKGICPGCGVNLNREACRCKTK